MSRQSWMGWVFMGAMLVAGCGDPNEKRLVKARETFGPAMDAQRTSLSILPIPANAMCMLDGPNSASWTTGDAEAYHMAKTVAFDAKITTPVSETDTLRAPKGLLTIETTYSPDGKSVSKQIFKVDGKELKVEAGKAFLKTILEKEAARKPVQQAVEEVVQKK